MKADGLIEFVKRHKGSVMAPKSIAFLDALLVTSLGEVDKKAVKAPYWEGHLRAVNQGEQRAFDILW